MSITIGGRMLKNKTKIAKNISIHTSDIVSCSKQRIFANNAGSSVIIPHVCNNINLFGAGFAGYISNRYPIVKENFHLLGSKSKLGNVQYISVEKNNEYHHELVIANMIAQNSIIGHNNQRPLNYEYLVKCMINVRNFILDHQNKYQNSVEIHCPKFGSGLAGGNWNFIQNLIEDIWASNNVFVYIKS